MLFKELSKGRIFTMLGHDGTEVIALKVGERHAIELRSGEELKVHLTKKVNLPAPIRSGEFAIDADGKPMIVERLKNGSYACEYVEKVGRGILPESQVAVFDRFQGQTREQAHEVYIILSGLEKTLKNAQTLLESVKVMIEGLQ